MDIKEFIVLDYNAEVGSKLKAMGYEKSSWNDFNKGEEEAWIVADQDDKTYADFCHSHDDETCPIFQRDEFLANTFSVPFD